ncbi:MAG: ABC transporter permease subunit [Lachnospiraceae bacterium]|nr:ABC transporter permease subunit [Lachnospiraceae bacterium]
MNQAKTKKEILSDKLYYPLRIAILLSVVFLFIPALNPTRISGLINKNLSLFTAGISYSSLTSEFGRAFKKGWVMESSIRILYVSAIAICLGIAANAVNGCMSLGNTKFRKLGNLISIIGCVFQLAGMAGIYAAYGQVAATSKPKRVEPMFANSFWLILAAALIILVFSIVQLVLLSGTKSEEKFEMETKFKLFLMFLPFIALSAVFSYLPLWGWRYAFFDYKVGDTLSMDKFVGFKWFTELVKNPATVRDIVNVLKNTLAMSGIGILTSWMPMAFAIFLCEMKNMKFRRFVQTFTTVPNFISWVLVYAIAFCIFSTDGFLSSLFVNMGVWEEGKNLLMSGEHMWIKMWAWGTWKGIGWSAIIYIAAISGIDQQLYEAATVDGAGRFQKMWHVTMPGLVPTFFVLLLMSVANILSNGMDQYLVFKNATNTTSIMVLDLYVYDLGIGKGSIPLTTVVSMLKSIISVILLFGANGFSKLVRGESIV